jgi:tetratricopeptide (TPR) repeat protein
LSLFYSDCNDKENFTIFNEKYISTSKEYLDKQKEEESKFGLKLYDELDEAEIFEGIAAYHHSKNEFEEELGYQLKSLGIRQKHIDIKTNNLILLFGNIATTYGLLGNFTEAVKYNKQAVEYTKQYLPNNHRYSITARNNYSVTLGKLGDWENSLKQAKQAFIYNQSNFEDITHPTFGELSFNVALAYLKLGKKRLAKENIENTIECWKKLSYEHENMKDAITFYQDMVNSLPSTSSQKTGRNEPCPCGSGKKYKKCCEIKTCC